MPNVLDWDKLMATGELTIVAKSQSNAAVTPAIRAF